MLCVTILLNSVDRITNAKYLQEREYHLLSKHQSVFLLNLFHLSLWLSFVLPDNSVPCDKQADQQEIHKVVV